MYPEMEAMVMAELDRTIAEYRVDTNRVYLQGNSMGGEGAYRIASRWPQRFAALVVSAGQVRIESPPYPALEVALDRRANPFSSASDPYAALAASIKTMRVWLFHSDADEVISVEEARLLVAALRKAGNDVKYTELTGVNHNGTPGRAYQDELFQWLFAQHR
jgi:predicted peptidase